MSEDTGFFRTLAGYATARARHAKDRWLADSPQTYYSAGGTGDYQWQGQAVDRDELKQVKQIRETGGMVAQLYHAKALIRFGTGAELQAEDDALQRELQDLFPSLDNLVLDLGEDAIWYPYALAEPIETNGNGFSHYECVEPWTTVPRTDDHGEIIAWEHEVNRQEQVFMPDELAHITVNKSSGRDTVGISDVLRSEDEITQYKENQRAINHAIELAGFPHNVWQVGAEGKAPVSDNELRRVRNIVQDPAGDTQWVMGSDIEIDQIQPGEFDFQSITERDLRMLTGAIGLPFELVGYGSDGLGSGHEAELKMNLLAIQNEADRRRFAEQFVDRFVRPVVERYTAFSADEDITLHIEPFLDDKQDLAEWIETAGDYLRNEDVVEKLGLPPIEDDEMAEAYRPPQQIEEAEEEEQGGLPGGGGGLFSDGRALQEVPANARPISDRSECDGSVIEGPQGGMYCVPEGGGGGDGGGAGVSDEQVQEAVADLPENYDGDVEALESAVNDIVENGGTYTQAVDAVEASVDGLDSEAQAAIRQQAYVNRTQELQVGDETVDASPVIRDAFSSDTSELKAAALDQLDDEFIEEQTYGPDQHGAEQEFDAWRVEEDGSLLNDNTAELWGAAIDSTGNENIPDDATADPDTVGDPLPAVEGEEPVTAVGDNIQATQEVLRDMFGDTVPVARGVGGEFADEIREARENGESVELDHRALESWSTFPEHSQQFADEGEGGGVIIQAEVPVEEVYGSSFTTPGLAEEENELVVAKDGPQEYDPDQIFDPDDDGMADLYDVAAERGT